MVRLLTFNLSFIRKANMTISTETKGRNLEDICGVGNEKTVLSYKQLAGYAIILAETIQVMQDHSRDYEKRLQDAEYKNPSPYVLPEYLNVKDKVVIDASDVAGVDPILDDHKKHLDLNQFIQICENVPPLCWSHFIGKTDGAMQLTTPSTGQLNDLANELEQVSSEAAAAVRAYIEKHCAKNWEVKFSRLVEQDFTIIVQAATEQEARDEVLRYGVDATATYLPDWDEEREYEVCANIESVEQTDEEI